MEACVQMEYTFRKTITSDFSDENIRTFEAKPPYLCSKKSDVLRLPECRLSLLLQKKFLKNTCISYTTLLHTLYLLTKSLENTTGVGNVRDFRKLFCVLQG